MGDEENVEMSSHEVMMWLSDVETARYVAFQELFETDGWKLFKEYAQAKVTEFGVAGANAQTWEANRVALGARVAWDEVAKAADSFMNSFEQLARSNRDEAAEAKAGSSDLA